LRYFPENEDEILRVDELRRQRYLTMKEFAECVGKTPNTVRRWHNQGLLRSLLVSPGDRRLPISELYRYERGEMMQEREEGGAQR
jgi:transcriptional regulator with XRE-family HTH domain